MQFHQYSGRTLFRTAPFRRYRSPDGLIHLTCRWADTEHQLRTLLCAVAEIIVEHSKEISVDISDEGVSTVTCLNCIVLE